MILQHTSRKSERIEVFVTNNISGYAVQKDNFSYITGRLKLHSERGFFTIFLTDFPWQKILPPGSVTGR